MSGVTPIPTDTYRIGFIGAGKIAESIARGVVESNILPASRISTAHSGSGRRDAFQSFGVKVRDHNKIVVQDSDVVIFSVRPQIGTYATLWGLSETCLAFKETTVDTGPEPNHTFSRLNVLQYFGNSDKLDVTMLAGSVPSAVVKAWLKLMLEWAGHSRFIRVMPITPAAVGKAASGMWF
ncbi:hypothetical protein RJ639_009871 [Escallonia herrerae]|uniref:Pyrroline-5-carboxylate reductase catalytic N-terminal domain-containing protein n=1 Tax=Escallonia herrerae TaxID=1293975 RepID=A0AA89ART4_9ASTE|nr:hypothetical protein RJ639_009871 [Escallonia herrerae]